MKSAEYRLVGGGLLLISYDEDAPCRAPAGLGAKLEEG